MLPADKPPKLWGNCTLKQSCRQNCVLPLALSPAISVIPLVNIPPAANLKNIFEDPHSYKTREIGKSCHF